MTSFTQLLVAVLPIIITALLAWISPYAVRYLDAHIGAANTKNLTEFAHAAVTAAEQQVKNGANSDKKDIALAALSAFAADNKYKVSAQSLDTLIEAAVFALKQWGQPITLGAATGQTLVGETVSVPAVPVVQVAVPVASGGADSAGSVPVAEEASVEATSNPNVTF